MSDIFEGVFGQSLSSLKVKNLDSASLHEIISEFAPLLTGDTIAKPKKTMIEDDSDDDRKMDCRDQDVEVMDEVDCTTTLKDSPEIFRNEEGGSVKSSSPDETDSFSVTDVDTAKAEVVDVYKTDQAVDYTKILVDRVKPSNVEDIDGSGTVHISKLKKPDSFKVNDDGALDLSLHSSRENMVVSSHPTSVITGDRAEHSIAHSLNSVQNHSIGSFQSTKPKSVLDNITKKSNDLSSDDIHVPAHSSSKLTPFPSSTIDHLNQLKNGLVKGNNGLDNFLLSTNLIKLPVHAGAVPEKLEMDKSKDDLSDSVRLRMRGLGRYKIYQCQVCSQVFDTKYHLNRHMMLSHEGVEPFVCEVCSKAFAQKCDLTRHMNVHYNVKKHYCKVCGKSFKRADYLAKHEKEFCSVFRPHRCEKCGRCYATEEELSEHIASHEIRLAHKCDKCDDSFQEEADLLEHKKQHKDDKPHACPLCTKKFPEFKDFVSHYKEHSGQRPFKCALCDKVFTRNHNLMTHLWIHNKIKNHFCPHCGKTFTYYSNLQVHLRVHTGERPYICGDCNKSFLTSSDLRRHHRTHSGDKPYICKTCKMAFTRKERLMQHRTKEHH